jgi:hypothetical protein
VPEKRDRREPVLQIEGRVVEARLIASAPELLANGKRAGEDILEQGRPDGQLDIVPRQERPQLLAACVGLKIREALRLAATLAAEKGIAPRDAEPQ